MADHRVQDHPIIDPAPAQRITFYWQGKQLSAVPGETITAALFAHGIHILGHHPRNGAPQSLFCANGQCSQCMVIADGLPVKACMQPVRPEMRVEPCDGLPALPPVEAAPPARSIPIISTPVLIIGGGPAGISAAIELGKSGVEVLLIDDKPALGGKLLLQTHRFFGSTEAVYAGTRGIDIATRLSQELSAYLKVTVWTDTTAVAVFSDHKIGVVKDGAEYRLVEPKMLLVAAGAREKFLAFPGNSLPGVFGAGAFQTLLNRDLVKPAERVFIIGGGNVGLIAGYHALQAGIQVAGLAEILPAVGGYKVHRDKLARLGVPIFTSHTILSANGDRHVESVTIAAVAEHFQPIPGSEQTFACDALLIAVGLDPIQEFTMKASAFGMPVFSAGDAEEIAEASAAIYSGKIRGAEIAQALGVSRPLISPTWRTTMDVLKSHPGPTSNEQPPAYLSGVFPVLHCTQEIPCDPCVSLCPHGLLRIDPEDIRKTPVFVGDANSCKACLACVAGCPGLAITLVDFRKNTERPLVTIPWEFTDTTVTKGDEVLLVNTVGEPLEKGKAVRLVKLRSADHTRLLQVEVPSEVAPRVAGIRLPEFDLTPQEPLANTANGSETIVCRCEQVTQAEIRALIRDGCRDLNEIKAFTRAGMGACGSKTCANLILHLFKEEGVQLSEVTLGSHRPLFVEVPLRVLAGHGNQDGK